MNTGLQDAFNLGWKLALVIQGKAREGLLDTYHAERISLARKLVRTTDRAFYVVNSQKAWVRFFRLRILPPIARLAFPTFMRITFIREIGFRTISGIAIHYRKSALSRETPGSRFPFPAPRPGDRVPRLGKTRPHQAEDIGPPQHGMPDVRMERGRALEAVHFAWAGSYEPGEPHYYRLQGPRLLVEYDNTQNDVNHIHSIWRDPEGDFGADLLARHYAEAHAD